MRQLLAVLLMLSAAAAQVAKPSASHAVHASAVNPALRPFVGSWRLVSSVEVLPDGTSRPYGFGPHAAGYLMYDATGHVCAQVVDPDRPKWKDPEHPTPEELKTAFAGFGGYCGRFTVDAAAHTAAHIPEISFDPTLAGEPKPRSYRFEDGRLIYSGAEKLDTGGESHWTMIWERVK